MYFEYGDAEICYLKKRDARLAEVTYHWTADIDKSSGYNLEKDAEQYWECFR